MTKISPLQPLTPYTLHLSHTHHITTLTVVQMQWEKKTHNTMLQFIKTVISVMYRRTLHGEGLTRLYLTGVGNGEHLTAPITPFDVTLCLPSHPSANDIKGPVNFSLSGCSELTLLTIATILPWHLAWLWLHLTVHWPRWGISHLWPAPRANHRATACHHSSTTAWPHMRRTTTTRHLHWHRATRHLIRCHWPTSGHLWTRSATTGHLSCRHPAGSRLA